MLWLFSPPQPSSMCVGKFVTPSSWEQWGDPASGMTGNVVQNTVQQYFEVELCFMLVLLYI